MKEKEVEIDWEGKKAKVLLRKLSYGDRNECLRKATKINPMTQSGELDPYTFNENRLLKAVKSGPWGAVLTLETVKQFEPEVGDYLVSEIDKLNELDAEIIKKSSDPSAPSA